MLNIKSIIAATLLAGVAVSSFAQAVAAPAAKTAATPAIAATAATTKVAAKPDVKHIKKHKVAKPAKTPAESVGK